MIKLSLGANLAAECGERCRAHLAARQNLDRFNATEQAVFPFEDVAHTAVADRVENTIRSERELRVTPAKLLSLPTVECALLDEFFRQQFIREIDERTLA